MTVSRDVGWEADISVSASAPWRPPAGDHDCHRPVEALCRYLRCQPGERIEFHLPLDEGPQRHVNELYPPAAASRPTDREPKPLIHSGVHDRAG